MALSQAEKDQYTARCDEVIAAVEELKVAIATGAPIRVLLGEGQLANQVTALLIGLAYDAGD